jgi:hypothetical protein
MSRLLNNSDQYRKREFARNASTTYTPNDPYGVSHPNAKSDGDTKGKGEQNGSIGSSVDIAKREELQAKNSKWFTKNKPYDASRA